MRERPPTAHRAARFALLVCALTRLATGEIPALLNDALAPFLPAATTNPEPDVLCKALRAFSEWQYDPTRTTDPASAHSAYANRLLGLAATRALAEQNCAPDEDASPHISTPPADEPAPEVPVESLGLHPVPDDDAARRAAGVFGPKDAAERRKLEMVDREQEWAELKRKHALRALRIQTGEAFAFEPDLADASPLDEALARWVLGKGPTDSLPDARLRLGLMRLLQADRAPALEQEYGPMDRSELLQKLANIGRVVVLALCRADQASALYAELPLPSMLATFDGGVAAVEGTGAVVVQLALREFVLRKLDQLTEEGALWWKRWASAFTLKVCCAKKDEGEGELVDEGSAGDCGAKDRLPMGECREDLKAWPSTLGYPDGLDGGAQSKIPELMASEASRVWLERLLDTLGGQLQGSVQWATAIKPVLIGAGWSDAETAPWKLQVEHWLEKIESDEVRRRRLLARARIVDRYRTMMKQLRENERFVSEERTKLYRLGLLPPVADVQPKGEPSDKGVASENYAALTNGATQRDLDAKWMAEYRKFTALRESYARFKGDDQTPVEARCSGKPTLYGRPATGLPGLRTAAAKLGDVVGKVDPTLGNSIGQMFGREYEAVDPECQVRFRAWADRSHGHPKGWIQEGADRDRPEREMILRPQKVPAPPRANRPVPADAFYGGFQPYEAQTPSREVGPQIYPSNYFRPYYPPQHASAIY